MGSDVIREYRPLRECTSTGSVSYGIVQPGSHVENGVPIIRVNNINDGSLDITSPLKVDPQIDEKHRKTRLEGGEVLLSLVGTTGQCVVAGPELKGWNVARAIAVIKPAQGVSAEWISICLKSQAAQHYLDSRANTTVQKTLNLQDVREIPIMAVSETEERYILEWWTTLNDKIELNQRMNATLEGMAQALFKSWFVDFDPVIDNALAAGNPIPDELAPRAEVRKNLSAEALAKEEALANGTTQQGSLDHPTLSDPRSLFPAAFEFNAELGWIPEGWEVRAIGDSFQLLGGHSFKSGDYVEDGQFGIVTIKNVQDGSFVQECTNRITEIPGKMKSHCYLNSGDILLSLTGNVGRVCIVSEGDYLLNQRVSKIVGRDEIPEAFGYFFFRQESLYERMITIAKGTAQQNLSPIETTKLEQVMPPNETIAKLGQQFRAFHTKMVGNTAQSQTLTKLRDTLLPKLIAGDLRLSEAEPLTEEALA